MRGPVRGPSHRCKQCNQGHRWHDSVVFVQQVRTVHGAGVLIIRRSWVRAPPAPPVVIRYIRCRPWDRCRRYRMSPDRPSGPALAVPDLVQRGPARTRLRFQLTPRPRCGDPQAKTHPRPIGTAPAGQQAFLLRPSKGPEPLKGKRPTAAPFQEVAVTRETSSETQDRRVPDRSDPLHGQRRTAHLRKRPWV
jgi:hypothetical protein